jgi:hypothetical protein
MHKHAVLRKQLPLQLHETEKTSVVDKAIKEPFVVKGTLQQNEETVPGLQKQRFRKQPSALTGYAAALLTVRLSKSGSVRVPSLRRHRQTVSRQVVNWDNFLNFHGTLLKASSHIAQ